MTFLRAVLNRSVVNDMTTQSLRELRTLSLLNSSRPVSKYDKWRRKSLTKAPEPPAVSMVSARLQGSPFGSSKRKNSRLVSEEDREHLRQILEKELEEKEQKAKAAKVVVKEIRFGPQTDDHDYNFKLKHAVNFLNEGSKIKAYVFFKGRSILFKEQGEELLLRFANDLEEYGKVEQMPVLEGKRMIIMVSPKKKK